MQHIEERIINTVIGKVSIQASLLCSNFEFFQYHVCRCVDVSIITLCFVMQSLNPSKET